MKGNIPETRFSLRLRKREQELNIREQDLVGLTRTQLFERLKAALGSNPIREIALPQGNTLLQIDETAGPTESHYDRVFVPLLEILENEGKIGPNAHVLETSTGSAGISFAWAAKKLEFQPHVFMPSYVPEPRILETQRLAGTGSVVLVDDRKQYIKACSDAMVQYLKWNREMIRTNNGKIWMANHSQDLRVPAFFSSIAAEVYNYVQGSSIDYFIGGIGNGSTILGIGKRLKEFFPASKVIGFEPHRAATYYNRYYTKWGNFVVPILGDGEKVHTEWSFHDLPGTGGSGNVDMPFINFAIEREIMDDIVPVDERFILNNVRYNEELSEENALGHSTLVARAIAERMALDVQNKVFFTLSYDRADRYGTLR